VVPARLSLRNFLSYREPPPLDFTGVHVACLSGDNGHGKSALLDAITWALWGCARTENYAELVTLGERDMEVDFEFWAGDARYRVIRKYQRPAGRGSGRSTLAFQVYDGTGWRDISGSTQAETQRRVVDVLKLSYDTFVNSAFLLQNQSGRFTRKAPGERKEVLAEILGLSRYDELEERAKERRQRFANLVTVLTQQIEDAEAELKRLPGLRAELATVTADCAAVADDLQRARATRDDLRRLNASRDTLQAQLARLRRDHEQAGADLAAAEERAAATRRIIAQCAAVIADAEAIRTGYAAWQDCGRRLEQARAERGRLEAERDGYARARSEAVKELDEAERTAAAQRERIADLTALVAQGEEVRAGLDRLRAARAVLSDQTDRLARLAPIQREIERLEAGVRQAEQTLRAELDRAQTELARLEEKAALLPVLRQEWEAARQAQAQLAAMGRELATRRQEEADLRGKAEALRVQNQGLRVELDELKRKFDELKAAVERGEADCPLCRSAIGHDGLRRIEESYQAEGRAKQAQYRENRRRVQELEQRAEAQAAEVRRLEQELERRTRELSSRVATLERDIQAAEAAEAAVAGLRAQVERLSAELAEGAFAVAERAAVTRLRDEVAAIGYDAAAYEAAAQAVKALAPFEERHQALVRAESELKAAREGLVQAEQRAARAALRRHELDGRLQEIEERLGALAVAALEQEYQRLAVYEERHHQLAQAQVRVEEARQRLASDEAAADSARRRREAAQAEIAEVERRLQELADVPAQLASATERVVELEQRYSALTYAKASCENEIERLEGLERQAGERKRRLEEAKRAQSLYGELVQAFGKRGVQALLIDAALPEIEQVANDLLARMTGNRMHVALETQRVTQKGTVQETLDIKISDEWGTRSYEMFSGGEAFRIDLALRIALSKLLTRRAGAPLATLVIDEGFGSQDASGRERLIEALRAIQDDFQCLLIVTHLDDLKELFDTRIEVTKSVDGSVARVVTA
jgi:exonuclease SbcC